MVERFCGGYIGHKGIQGQGAAMESLKHKGRQRFWSRCPPWGAEEGFQGVV